MKLTGFKNTLGVTKSLAIYNIGAGLGTNPSASTNFGNGMGEIGDDLNTNTFTEVPYQFVTNVLDFASLTDTDVAGVATGATLYYDGTDWVDLPAGTAGQILSSTATGTDWITAPSGADGDAWGVAGEDETSAVARVGAVGVGSNTAPTETLDVTGTFRNTTGGRFVVQGTQNGGTGRGIYMWNNNDSNWGIYMGQSGATRSLSGGSAPGGAGFNSHSIRFRAGSGGANGFIFENSAGTLLSSIRGSDGLSYFRGSVGIGSTSPSQKLHVVGNARITGAIFDSGNSAGTAGQVLSSTATGTDWITAPTDGDAWGVGGEDETSAVARVGAVGVGSNTAPTETLDVTGTFRNTTGGRFVVQGTQNGGTGRGIYMWNNNDSNWGIYMGQSGATRSLSGGSAPGGAGFNSHSIRFRAGSGGANGFIFENSAGTLLSSIRGSDGLSYFRGSVGIGSTSPSQKLHVVGNARITGAIFDSGNSAGTAGQVLSSTVTGTEWVETGATATPISETEYNAIAASNTIVGSTDAKLAAVNSGAYTRNFGTLNPAATHQVKNTQSVFAIKFRNINSNTATRFVAALTDTSTGIVEYVSVPLLYTTSSGTFPYTYMKLTGFKNTTGVAKSLSLYNITAGMATTTNTSTNFGTGMGEIGDDLNTNTFSEVPYQFVTNYVPYEKIVIWAEESAGLGSNQLEWSFGDGASGNIGIPLPEDWEAYAVSFNADNNGAADTIEMAIINSNTNTNLFTFTASGNPNNMVYTEILATPVAIPAGTSIGFRTVTEIGNVTNARVAVFLRRTP